MGIRDVIDIFKKETSKLFKFSVMIASLSYVSVIAICIFAFVKKGADHTFDLQKLTWLSLFLLVIQVVFLLLRNVSKHKIIKGSLFFLLKSMILIIFFFLLYVLRLQELMTPIYEFGEGLFTISAMVSLSTIKILLG